MTAPDGPPPTPALLTQHENDAPKPAWWTGIDQDATEGAAPLQQHDYDEEK